MSTVWLIASGKGGVGKSTVASAMACALSLRGERVCLVDADIGLRDLDAILGIQNSVVYDLMDVAKKDCPLRQALVPVTGFQGVSLLAASQFARSKDLDPKAFRKVVDELRKDFGHVIIDCPAGIERGLRGLFRCAPDETVVVSTPDDVCLRDAERLVALLREKELPSPRLIVNRVVGDLVEAGEMHSAAACAQALDVPLLGEIPDDPQVYRALLCGIALMNADCPAQQAMERIADRMLGRDVPAAGIGTQKKPFLRRLFRSRLKEVKTLDR